MCDDTDKNCAFMQFVLQSVLQGVADTITVQTMYNQMF